MPITKTQLEERRTRLGGSDIPTLLGLNPWKNAYDLWLDKTGKLEPDDSMEDNQAVIVGNEVEPSVINWASHRLGKVTQNQPRRAKGLPIMSIVDAIVKSTGEPLEIKTSGILGPLFQPESWGDDGSDQVPDMHNAQCQTHMLCTEADRGYLAALLGGRGFVLYDIPRNQDVIDIIVERGVDFWENHVKKDIPPEDIAPSAKILKFIKRQPNKVVQVSDEAISKWRTLNDIAKITKDDAADAKSALIALLGDAESGVSPTMGEITFFEQSRAGGLDLKAYAEDHPESHQAIVENYTKPKTVFRVCRFKKVKVTK